MDPTEGWNQGFLRIGDGELGGKAGGLVFLRDMLAAEYPRVRHPELDVAVPCFAVLTTDVFDAFVERNDLRRIASSLETDDEISRAFQSAPLPEPVRATLARLIDHVRTPLAVRSSSLLEDAIFCPFAGVYETKMIPNNHPDTGTRLDRVELAVKLVLASTFHCGARSAHAAMGKDSTTEKMAVIIQEIVGNRCGDRFYPRLSGVARSHDFYARGSARPEDGVISLALGLGKTIVDGGNSWSYSPARPAAPPPFGSTADLLQNSQIEFWYVDLALHGGGAPTEETEFMRRADLGAAEADGALGLVASTYDGSSDRLVPGMGPDGPRVLNFAPLLTLKLFPFNAVIRELMAVAERAAGGEVEIEFALRADDDEDGSPGLELLQVRPMVVSHETVTIGDDEWSRDDVLLASTRVMGNGVDRRIRDVVFVDPDGFEGRHTPVIASELEQLNRELVGEERPYLLIGFGRWGSSDPWLGIPVEWSQICGAGAIVEATLPTMNVEPSQGTHFFHNISSCGISYFTVHHSSEPGIDWDWLQNCPAHTTTRFLRRVVLDRPLEIKVDGRSRRGAVWRSKGG